MKRILHVNNAPVYGGAEEGIRTLFTYMDAQRYELYLAGPPTGLSQRVKGWARWVPFHARHKGDLRALRELDRIVRRLHIDLVHTHSRREDLLAAFLHRTIGVATVTTIHDRVNMDPDGHRRDRLTDRVYLKVLQTGFCRLLAVSERTRQDTVALVPPLGARVVHVVNGMDLARLDGLPSGEQARQHLGWADDVLRVGISARVVGDRFGKKGHVYFLEAAARLQHEFPSVQFVIVGEDASSHEPLGRVREQCGLAADRLHMLGFRDDILVVYRALDVVVLPSLFEGLPRSLMEAMAVGTPVVGSRVDGTVELLEDGRSGLVCSPADACSLADAVARLLGDDALRHRLGQAGAQRIRDHYDGRLMAQQTEAVYRDVLGA